MSEGDGKRRGPLLVPLGGPDRAPIPPRGPAHPAQNPPPPLRREEEEAVTGGWAALREDAAASPDVGTEAEARGSDHDPGAAPLAEDRQNRASDADRFSATTGRGASAPPSAVRPARTARLRTTAGPAPSPADAPPIDDGPTGLPNPRAMELVTRLAGREPPAAVKLFVNAGGALLAFLLSVAALRFIDDLMTRYPLLGWIGVVLFALFTLATLALSLREYMAFRRLRRIDTISRQAVRALADSNLTEARAVAEGLEGLYAGRPELARGRQRLREARAESYDAPTLLAVAEAELLAPLDQQARREIEAAARTVAAATALVPLALADVAAALFANLRMIRRMAEIYGGRAGAIGGWRLARTVMTHLVATGAVSAGDDLIHTVAGGGVLARLSRRFGEGVVNGALTARVGIAAMEVCRPLPFIHQPRPKVGNLIARGLKGLFGET